MKGVKGAQRSDAMQAVIQNLEAMGNTVEYIESPTPANGVNGQGRGDGKSNGKDADDSSRSDAHVEVTVQHPNGQTEDIIVNADEDENAPLLGGKQLASSPGRM